MTEGIFLLLGSNQGDKRQVLDRARQFLSKLGSIVSTSVLYQTAAWGKEDQPTFYNQVVQLTTELNPQLLLAELQKIEDRLGRIRHEKWGPRIIDIDILYYHHEVLTSANLEIPHPGIPDRRFTLEPLCEIAPSFIHPVLRKSNSELLDVCADQLDVRPIDR